MKKHFGFLFLFILFVSCSGKSLLDGLSSDLAVGEKQLVLSLAQYGTPQVDAIYPDLLQEDGTKRFQNNLGVTIILSSATVSIAHVTLVSDGDDSECGLAEDLTLQVESTHDLMSEDLAAISLFDGLIADDVFCQYKIELAALSKNTTHTELNHAANTAEHSIYLAGSWQYNGQSGDFEIESDNTIIVSGVFAAFEDGMVKMHALHFHDDSLQKDFGIVYDRFFDWIDFSETQTDLEKKILANLSSSVQQHLSGDASVLANDTTPTDTSGVSADDGHDHVH